jgi:ABC-type nitrate/sulfonate/bicarbonate transport system permease component
MTALDAPTPVVAEPARRAPDLEAMADVLRRRRARIHRKRVFWATVTPLAVLVVWEVLSRTGVFNALFLPAPTTIVSNSAQMFADPERRGELLGDMAASGVRLVAGFVLGTILGLVVGIAMGLSPTIRYALSVLINGTYPLPKLTLFPLMIIFFGVGETSMIALVTLGVFFMVAINTAAGVTYSNPMHADFAKAFQVPRSVRIRRIAIPAAIPSIISGIKLGYGQALIIVIATEFVAGGDGVGYLIWNSWQTLDVPAMFVGLAVVAVVGWLGSLLISAAGRKIAPWEER